MTGWRQIRVGKQAVEGDPHGGHRYIYEGGMVHCWDEEGEPWGGRDQTSVIQMAVSFP